MSTEANRRVAKSMFELAARLVMKLGDEDDSETAFAALQTPNSSTCRALLAQGRGKPWLPSVRDALAEVGIAAAEDILGGHDDE